MAKTYTAAFAQTSKTGFAETTTAVASIETNAPTNTVLVATAGAEGALLTSLSATPRATVTANALYLFISKDNGVTKELVDSALMEAHTVATTTAIPVTDFANISESTPIRLEAGDELYAGIGVTANVVFKAELTDY